MAFFQSSSVMQRMFGGRRGPALEPGESRENARPDASPTRPSSLISAHASLSRIRSSSSPTRTRPLSPRKNSKSNESFLERGSLLTRIRPPTPSAPSPTHLLQSRAMEDNTLETRDSGISDLSALDSTTDDFYKRGVDYLRRAGDERRMQHPSSGHVQPFRRARPVNKLALTMENLERNNAVSVNNGPPKESHQDASIQLYSTSGSDSTGSPNVPKQWGRKGRQRNEFLRRINSTSAATAPARERERDPDLIYPYRTGFTGDTSPRLRRTASTFERDPLAQRRSDKRNTIDYDTRNTTLDEIMELEKESAFVDNGSPTASKSERRKRSESITQKEIQSLRARAVTTSRLAEDGRTLRRPKSLADAFNQADATVDSILGDLNTSRNNPARHDNAYSQSLPDALKGRESTAPVADNPSPANAGSRTFDEEPPRSRSSELLRQLARASSTTPSSSPNSPRRRPPGIPQRTSSHRSRASQSSKSQNHASPGDMLGRDRPLTPKSTSSTDPRRRKLSEKTDSALVKTERGLGVAEESFGGSLSNNRLSDKPALKDSPIQKTPDIVGAWIDTPATQAGRYRLHHSASDGALSCRVGQQSRSSQAGHERQGAKYLDNPPYAKSVLEALLGDRSRKQGNHARPHKDEGPDAEPLNDETIASLQELAETDPSQAQSLLDIDDTTLDLIANVSTPLSSRKPTGRASLSYEAQRQEQLALQRMAKTLKNARHGLKDTSRRLQRVEHEVELEGTSRIPDAQIKKYGCCPYCGCPGAAGRSGPPVTTLERGKVQITRQVEQDTLLSFMLTLLWWVCLSRLYVRRKEDNRIRLTRTGWGLLIFVVWAVVEDMLWEIYCSSHWQDSRYPGKPCVTLDLLLLNPTRPYWAAAYNAVAAFLHRAWPRVSFFKGGLDPYDLDPFWRARWGVETYGPAFGGGEWARAY